MTKTERSNLALALDHVCLATSGPAAYAPYCRFDPAGGLVGFDGIVAAGYAVNERENAAPQADSLRQAVNRAGNPYSLTFNHAKGECVVKGDKMRAAVPMLALDQMPNAMPGAPLREVAPILRDAMRGAGKAASRKHSTILGSAVLLRANSAVATDGTSILEGWHGCNLPGDMLIPVELAEALGKVKLPLSHIGYDSQSLTMWFGNMAWLSCKPYVEPFPDVDVLMAQLSAASEDWRRVPGELTRACEALKPFRQSSKLTVTAEGLNTMPDGSGAAYSLPHGWNFRGELPFDSLKLIAEFAEWIKFSKAGAYWQGEMFRGATALN